MPDRTPRRDPAIIPLSHDHQRALALCLRLGRWKPAAGPSPAEWGAEVLREIDGALLPHFLLEEEVLFPGVGRWMGDRGEVIADLLEDHRRMRAIFDRIRGGGSALPEALRTLGPLLQTHVRKEERVFFPLVQERVPPDALARLAARLDHAPFCPAGPP